MPADNFDRGNGALDFKHVTTPWVKRPFHPPTRSLIPARAGTSRLRVLDKNGHASGLAEAVATPTHFVILSKNRPESYVGPQSKASNTPASYGQGITTGVCCGGSLLQMDQSAGAGGGPPALETR
jgi:hypothetical protein